MVVVWHAAHHFYRAHVLFTRRNIREVLEAHRKETDTRKIEKLLRDGWKNLDTLNNLSKWDLDTWKFGAASLKRQTTFYF